MRNWVTWAFAGEENTTLKKSTTVQAIEPQRRSPGKAVQVGGKGQVGSLEGVEGLRISGIPVIWPSNSGP